MNQTVANSTMFVPDTLKVSLFAMRILVLQNNKHKNSYTTCIQSLLKEAGNSSGYDIQMSEDFQNIHSSDSVIHFVTITPVSSLLKLLQQRSVHIFIKKNKTDLLIQNAGYYITQKRIPQLLVVDDVDQLPAVKKISYSKIFLLTYSLYAKKTLADKGFTNTVHVVPFVADDCYQPITWSMKQQLKIDYTEGSEYFFISQAFKSMNEILMLLKAFSGFKKWQHSSMKLVIAGKLYVPPAEWEEKWNTYRYRDDIMLYNTLPDEQKAKLLAGAYACIHLPRRDNELLPLLQSLQCHIPVIAFETASVKEYADGAVLTVAADNYDELTQQMILMYKDENLRDRLIENAVSQAEKYSREKAMLALQTVVF